MPQLLFVEVLYVGQVIDAIIAKFKLDAAPQRLHLQKKDGNSSMSLDPTQLLSEAGICSGTTLVVELTSAKAPIEPKKGWRPLNVLYSFVVFVVWSSRAPIPLQAWCNSSLG